ncbi:ATP-binding protein [Thermodesulfobacteriota bacterium]
MPRDPGTGKTGLAIGLLREALVSGLRGRFYKAQDLLDELYASIADRTTARLLKRLVRYDLLVIDELGYLTLNVEQVNAFFKLMDERYSRKSTIIASPSGYPAPLSESPQTPNLIKQIKTPHRQIHQE